MIIFKQKFNSQDISCESFRICILILAYFFMYYTEIWLAPLFVKVRPYFIIFIRFQVDHRKKVFTSIFCPGLFLPRLFLRPDFESLNIFNIMLTFFYTLKNNPGQCCCPGLFFRVEKNLSLVLKIFRDSKSGLKKSLGKT